MVSRGWRNSVRNSIFPFEDVMWMEESDYGGKDNNPNMISYKQQAKRANLDLRQESLSFFEIHQVFLTSLLNSKIWSYNTFFSFFNVAKWLLFKTKIKRRFWKRKEIFILTNPVFADKDWKPWVHISGAANTSSHRTAHVLSAPCTHRVTMTL